MNLSQLKYFCSVVEEKGFSAAAARREVSVQAVSKAMSDLERELGCELFKRAHRQVEPTGNGMEFYQLAQGALEAFACCEDFKPQAGNGDKEPLRIGLCTPPFANSDSICRQVCALLEKRLEEPLHMQVAPLDTAEQDLADQQLDALCTVGRYSKPGSTCMQVGNLPTAIAVAITHPLAKQDTVSLDDLRSYPAGYSPIVDEFNETILKLYLKNVEGIQTREVCGGMGDGLKFLIKERGYFFSALFPVQDKTPPTAKLIPIDPAQQLPVPICIVTLEHAQSSKGQHLQRLLAGLSALNPKF